MNSPLMQFLAISVTLVAGLAIISLALRWWLADRHERWTPEMTHAYFEAEAIRIRDRRGHNRMDLHCAYWDPRYSATRLDRCPVCNPERKP